MNKTILITGGAAFIGVNAAWYFGRQGWKNTVLDNLSRRGTEEKLRWLKGGVDIQFEKVDVRNQNEVARVIGGGPANTHVPA